MFLIQMLPWLIIACLLGVVIGLIGGMHISSSLFQRHHQETQSQPLVYQRSPTRYLDDDHYGRRR
jgi:hypothetical protein